VEQPQTINHGYLSCVGFIEACTAGGSNFMVAIVLVQMVKVFLSEVQVPRELTWIVGRLLLLLVDPRMAFTGQVCDSIRMPTGD